MAWLGLQMPSSPGMAAAPTGADGGDFNFKKGSRRAYLALPSLSSGQAVFWGMEWG